MPIDSGNMDASCSVIVETSISKEDGTRSFENSDVETGAIGARIDKTKLFGIRQPEISESTTTHLRDNLENVNHDSLLHHSFSDKQPLLPIYAPRGCLTETDARSFSVRQHSFSNRFGNAASQTCSVTPSCFTLLRYLGMGYRWMTKFVALALYGLLLMPGIIQVGWYYFFDKRIHRSIVYGPEPKNRLDLYLPQNLESPKPVVAFVTGGAWIIGYRAWGSLLGLQLVENDVIVACIDYRNFPHGTVSDMVEDVSKGISYICNNIADYGGDPDRLFLAGQSAGAHLAACTLVEQARQDCERGKADEANEEHENDEAKSTWRASQFKAYFGISGGYNLYKLVDHFHNSGLSRIVFLSIMEGEGSLLRYSPEVRVQSLPLTNAGSLFPRIYLFHGTADHSIPCDASTSFAEVLTSIGVQATTRLYEGNTHTDLFLQNPMRGGYDALLADILAIVHAGDIENQCKDAPVRPLRRLVPEFLLQFAHRVSPF